jgi:hypothetical protein
MIVASVAPWSIISDRAQVMHDSCNLKYGTVDICEHLVSLGKLIFQYQVEVFLQGGLDCGDSQVEHGAGEASATTTEAGELVAGNTPRGPCGQLGLGTRGASCAQERTVHTSDGRHEVSASQMSPLHQEWCQG